MTTLSPARTFTEPHIVREDTSDGRVLLRSTDALAPSAVSIVHEFRTHAETHPDRLLIAEPDGAGGWRRATWGEIRAAADRLAQGLLDRGLAERPVMILSGNSTLHLTVVLAAMTIGTPVVPSSVAYALQSSDHAKLRAMAELVDPGLVVAEDAAFAPAVAAVAEGRTVLGDVPGGLSPDDLATDPTATAACHPTTWPPTPPRPSMSPAPP